MQKNTKSKIKKKAFISEEDGDDDFDIFEAESKQDKVINQKIKEYGELSSKTLKMLFRFQKEILISKQFSTNEDLNIIIDLIREYILKIEIGITLIRGKKYYKAPNVYWEELEQSVSQIKEKLKVWLLKELKQNNLDHLFQILNNENLENNKDEKLNCNQLPSKQLIISTLNIDPEKIYFNKNNTLLFAQFTQKLGLYGFDSFNKHIRKVIFHLSPFKHLFQLKTSEQLLSIGQDKKIIIWNNDCQLHQILKDQISPFNIIIANDKDEFFTEFKNQVKFWKKKNFNWCCSQTFHIPIMIQNFSFNPEQTKLISYGYQLEKSQFNNYIYLIENQEELWTLTKIINLSQLQSERNFQIFFAKNSQFILFNGYLGVMEMFKYRPQTEEFFRTQLTQFSNYLCEDNCSSCQFIQQTNKLIVRHNQIIYQFQLDQRGEYELEQSIKFDQQFYSVVISQNSHYLLVKNAKNIHKILVLKLRNIK